MMPTRGRLEFLKSFVVLISVLFISVLLISVVGYSSAATATVKISTIYTEAGNAFDILDQVSLWWPDFCEEEYRQYWQEKYGLTDEDQRLFDQYKVIRKKHYDYTDQNDSEPLRNRNGFFANLGILSEDPLAIAFYSSSSLEEAFKNASHLVTPEELQFLKDFYRRYREKLTPLLKESEKFKAVAPKLDRAVKNAGFSQLFQEAEHFYNVKGDIDYRVLLNWWPPVKRTLATPVGKFLVFRYNPVKHLSSLESDSDIIFHEIVHTISARQALEQKQALTKQFLAKCDIQGKLKKKQYLEEPLAVAIGQLLYSKRFAPAKLDLSAHVYNDWWIGPFGKLIFPLVEQYFIARKTINDGFAEAAGKLCQEQVLLAKKLGESSSTLSK